MQNECWMRPALQKSEAVLLPALERRTFAALRFSQRFAPAPARSDAFLPAADGWHTAADTTALSTYVRPRGSMAGRSVLRAAGVCANPYARPLRTRRRRFR